MALIINTPIENHGNQHILDAKNVKGTYVVVETETEMKALPEATVLKGSLCYVIADSKFYINDGTGADGWDEHIFGITTTATQSADGLMSKMDKTKLDTIKENANENVQSDWAETDTTSDAYIQNKPDFVLSSEKGAAGGVATLDTEGKVPISQLPSYVDDIIEGYLTADGNFTDASMDNILTPEGDKIYVDLGYNKTYRWGGPASGYVEISASLALGETSSTAYAGDKGKALADRLTTAEGNITSNDSDIATLNTKVTNLENGTTPAGKANKLATAREISLTGAVTGSVDFTGDADVAITATLTNSVTRSGDDNKGTAYGPPAEPAGLNFDIPSFKVDDNGLITEIKNIPFLMTLDASDVGLENVVNTGDSDTPIEGGTTKFTTGGAFKELNKKVDKDGTKVLSTNDFTNELKGNYDTAYNHSQTTHAPSDARANIIETVKVNNTALTVTNKTVNITVPTGDLASKDKVSESDLDSSLKDCIEGLENNSHTHSNKALLDTYAQTETDLADAVSKKHEHSNFAVLNGITTAKVDAWDKAESNAKKYADSIQTAITNGTVTAANATTANNYAKNGTIDTALQAKYVKPTTGIPKTDLADSVQTSLGKADTAPIIYDSNNKILKTVTFELSGTILNIKTSS